MLQKETLDLELDKAKQSISSLGYIDLPTPPKESIIEEIIALKRKKNAVILAHYYQVPEIQELADYVGDSLGLSQEAAHTDADIILFAGVHFMAETAKILNPKKKVILPDLNAGCSLADSCTPDALNKFKQEHPDHLVVTYVNTSVEIKALSDITCTSSNAVKIIDSIPKDQKILFAPDRNLGAYIKAKTKRDLTLWEGACEVHEAFSLDKLIALHKEHPKAEIIAHPESEHYILECASFVGSTAQLISHIKTSSSSSFIVATEAGILHEMTKEVPNKELIPAPAKENNSCACSECGYMKLNNLEKLYLCLKYEMPEIIIEESLRKKALIPVDRMMQLSR